MIACLLIHGYMGTPFEVEPLAGPLDDLGFVTRLLTLPGHNSSLEEFRASGFREWAARAEAEYDALADEYDEIIVLGFSLGGALALRLAETRSPKAVVTLAAPVFPRSAWPAQIRDWLGVFLPGRKVLRPHRPEAQGIAPWRGYKDVVHPPHLYGLCRGCSEVRKNLGKVSAPILIFHDLRDLVVNSRNGGAIAWEVSSERIEYEELHIKEDFTVRHVITTHQETRNYIINRVRSFVADICGLPQPSVWAKTRELHRV